jgi:hypothetical protein
MAPIIGTDAQGRTTYTFNYTGSEEIWNIPSGVTKIKVELWGASGGDDANSYAGGKGAYVTGEMSTIGISQLRIRVGGKGKPGSTYPNGGYNGGGNSRTTGTVGSSGHGGGGATDIRINGSALSNRIIVAGGGGGAGAGNTSTYKGGAGGNAGQNGLGGTDGSGATKGYKGSGGSQASGGAAGENSGSNTSTVKGSVTAGSGTLGNGGSVEETAGYSCMGGGGGGGYYGGGAGGYGTEYIVNSVFQYRSGGGGGGGGSSFADSNYITSPTFATAAEPGDGKVVITVLNNPPTLTLASPTDDKVVSAVSGRRTITLSGTVSDADNNPVTISATINGKTKTTSVSNTSSAKSWSLTWDVVTDNIAQGTYTNIVVTAADGQGGTATATYTGTITVDKTSPAITISGVANGATYQNSVTPTFSATDSGGSGLASVTATLDGAAYTSGTAITASGSHTLVVTATDNAGNQAQQTVTFSINKAPTLNLTSPLENLLGTDGNCEDVNKFTFTDGNAVLDSTRKTQGTNSIKITKGASATYMAPLSSRYIKPAVDEYYLGLFDVYQDAPSSQVYVGYVYSGVTISSKSVTAVSGGFPASTTGQFVPIIRAFKVTAVNNPGTSWFYPRVSHLGGPDTGSFNVDSFRFYKITQAEYDALPTNVNLATAQAIAAQYPYVDPENVLTLAEGDTLPLQGNAIDTDIGNVVTVKYKINSGTTRALNSGVSDGSTPISFAKNLTFRDKRLWDGTTDVAGADLAENTVHTITVWAEDDKGGKSVEATRKFRVIWNRPPSISGQDENLGTMNMPPSRTYTVTEPEGNAFTITEKINDTVIRTFTGQPGVQNTITIPHDLWLQLEPGVQHTLKIESTDSKGMTSTRTYTFTRFEDRIVFDGLGFVNMPPELVDMFTTDVAAQRILLTPDWSIPPGAVVLVEATNNAFDAQPTWEDVTFYAKNNRGYLFTNKTKTAAQWGVNFRFTIEKGTATDPIIVKGIGGAFD